LNPYNYTKASPGYYLFTTASGAVYRCYFTSYELFFSDYPLIASKIFGFTLQQLHRPPGKYGVDKRIADTVVTIVRRFLEKKTNAVVYVCDNSDNLHKPRFYKFTQWFLQNDDGNIIQLKGCVVYEGAELYHAMLIHKDNKLKNEFITAFLDLNSRENK
jgi:Family of unknown function (DUF6169)